MDISGLDRFKPLSLNFIKFAAILILFLVLITPVIYLNLDKTVVVPESLSNTVSILSSVATLTLTLGLLILYEVQAEVSQEQAEIQENQEELMEASHRPLIDVDAMELLPDKSGDSQNDMLTLKLVNWGNGAAHTPELRTTLQFESDVYQEKKEEALLRPSPEGRQDSDQGLQTVLPPNGDVRIFNSSVRGRVQDGEDDIADSLSNILERLFSEDVDEVTVRLSVKVYDIENEEMIFDILNFDLIDERIPDTEEEAFPDSFEEIAYYGLSSHTDNYQEGGIRQGYHLPATDKTSLIVIRIIESHVSEMMKKEELEDLE